MGSLFSQSGGNMNGIKYGLSSSVAQIVKRLFTDESFKEDALANSELAFESYSLEPEEREALKSLMGNMGRRQSLFSVGPESPSSWWH